MKKGEISQRYLMGIILLVIFLFGSALFANKTGSWMQSFFAESECEREVISHAKMIKLSQGKKVIPIHCPTIVETLDGETEEEIKSQVAERMRRTWDAWQEGKENLFGNDRAVYCHTHYVLDFKNEDIEVNKFNKFLAETYIPGQKYSYLQYLSGFTNNEEFSVETLKGNPELEKMTDQFGTDTKKAILFVYVKDRDWIKETIGIIKNAGVGGVLIGGATAIIFMSTSPVIFIIGGIAGGIIGVEISEDQPLWVAYPQLIEYDAEEFENLDCEIAPTKQTNK
ncbi:hypothetical protein HQ533_01395 [Candidatus Woesearchaeota archaeon]|nr:hypothetical protein [Candidatus Woesearchaeota archaeon]